MGWFPFGFLQATPEKRIAAAKAMLGRGDYNEARLELEGIEHPDAAPIRAEALDALVELNLMEWRAQRAGGHSREAEAALDRARQFGASKDRIAAFQARKDDKVLGLSHRLPPK